jgi:hypothetical protein
MAGNLPPDSAAVLNKEHGLFLPKFLITKIHAIRIHKTTVWMQNEYSSVTLRVVKGRVSGISKRFILFMSLEYKKGELLNTWHNMYQIFCRCTLRATVFKPFISAATTAWRLMHASSGRSLSTSRRERIRGFDLYNVTETAWTCEGSTS